MSQQPLSSTQEKKSKLFYGYIIVLASFFILFVSWGSQYSFGVFFKPVLHEFGWTRAVTSGAYSLNMILSGVFSLVTGRLVGNKVQPRVVISIGGCLIGLGYFLMSRVATEWQYYLFYGVIISTGVGCMVAPLLTTVARWFTGGRGLASGIVLSGTGLGIVVMPQVANAIISKTDWRTSFLILSIISVVLIVILAQLVKRAPESRSSSVRETHKAYIPNIQSQGLSFAEAARTRTFWIFCMTSVFMGFVAQVVMVHIVAHATDIGFAAAIAATVLSAIGLVSMFGKVFMGTLSDRIGNRNIMIMVCFLYGLSFVWIGFAGQLWMLYLFAALFAAGYSGAAASHSPQVAEFFGLRAHGTIYGLACLLANIGGALGSFLAGYIFDATGSYQWAFYINVILCAIGVIISIFLPARKKVPAAVTAKSHP
jgi:MFS family permease